MQHVVRRLVYAGVISLLLTGCPVGLALVGAGAGLALSEGGIEQTVTGVMYKTFTASTAEVRTASTAALRRMGMKVTEDVEVPQGRKLVATTEQRTIEVEIEELTPTASRMRVQAYRGTALFKDRATATEVIVQTGESLKPPGSVAEQPDSKRRASPARRSTR